MRQRLVQILHSIPVLKRVLFAHTPESVRLGGFVVSGATSASAAAKYQKLSTKLSRNFVLVTVILGLLIGVIGGVFYTRAHEAYAATSDNLNFQARLLTAQGAVVPDGYYHVEFKIYTGTTSTGTPDQGACTQDTGATDFTCLWTETRTTGNLVRVANGYLTVNLGSVNPFPSTMPWDQQLYLSMRIGGASGSASWEASEMTPRMKLTAVPYAFSAGKLVGKNGTGSTTLDVGTTNNTNSIHLPDESGTICLQNSANCGFVTGTSLSGSTVLLQAGTPGTAQTGNFNISGVGILGTKVVTPAIDTDSAIVLQIGSSASGINLNKNTSITGTVDATSGFKVNGTSGATVTCSGGQFLQNQVVSGGIVTGGTCATASGGGSYVTLQAGTPGTADTGSLNIDGMGLFGSGVKTALLDTASAVPLNIGASSSIINLNKNTYVAGNVNITGAYQVNGTQISSANLSNDSNLAKLNGTGPQTFTGNNKFTGTVVLQNASNSTSAFQIQNSSGVTLLNMDTTDNTLTLRAGSDSVAISTELTSGLMNSGWNATDWDVTTDTASATHQIGNTTSLANTSVPVSVGEVYQVAYQAYGSCGTGSLTVSMGGVAIASSTTQCGGLISRVVTATSTTGLTFAPTSDWGGTISSVSIKRLTGVINPVLTLGNASGVTNLEVRSSNDPNSLYIGQASGRNNATGVSNTAVGTNTLSSNTTGNYNSAFGQNSLQSNTTGNSNTAMGYSSLSMNGSGNGNTAVGIYSLQNNGDGYNNVAIGNSSLKSNLSGSLNTALGAGSLFQNKSGSQNVSIGPSSMYSNATGSFNTSIGQYSSYSNTTGTHNVGLGEYSLYSNTTGSFNTAMGMFAGYRDSNLGFFTLNNLQRATAIGAYAQVQANDAIVLGSVDNPTKVGIGITVPSNTLSVSPVEYQAGQAKRTNGSATLLGSGTSWWLPYVGDIIVFADGTTNTVASIIDTTHITMGNVYTGTTDAGFVAYRFHKPGFNVASTGRVGVGNTAPAYDLDVTGNANASAYYVGGTAGSTVSCSGGQMLQNQVINKGIVTGGSCVSPVTSLTLAGDVTGASNSNTVTKIQNTALNISGPAGGQVLIWNGSGWTNTTVSGDATISTTGVLTISNGAVTSAKILDGTITGTDIASGTIASGNILDGTVTGTDIASGTVSSTNITDGTIANSDLSTGTFSNITGTGALSTGSINSGFGSIATGNNISTTATLSGNSITGGSVNITGTYQVSGVQISSANLSNDSNLAKLNGSQSFTGNNTFTGATTLYKNAANSATSFQIQNAGGTAILDVDTTNNRVGIGTASPSYALDVQGGQINASGGYRVNGTAGGSLTCTGSQATIAQVISGGIVTGGSCYELSSIGAGNFVRLQGGTPTVDTGSLYISGTARIDTKVLTPAIDTATTVPLTIGGTASRVDVTSNAKFTGTFTQQNAANSATAFQIQDSAGTALLSMNTADSTLTIRSKSPTRTISAELYSGNFSSGWTTTGWNVTSNPTEAWHTSGNTNALVNTSVPVVNGNTYQVSFMVYGSCGTGGVTVAIGGVTLVNNYTDCDSQTVTYVKTATSNVGLTFTPSSTWTGKVLAISIKTISGAAVLPLQSYVDYYNNTGIEVRQYEPLSTYIGLNSGSLTVSGTSNVSLGAYSLQGNTTGGHNVALGVSTMAQNSTGSSNTAIGNSALTNNITGNNNTAIGSSALQSNISASNNTAIGNGSMSANRTGWSNTAVGIDSLKTNISGTQNTAIGNGSMSSNTSGSNNVALGSASLYQNVSGSYNTAIGWISSQNGTGSYNTALGHGALYGATFGSYNTALGDGALYSVSGNFGTALGANSGYLDANGLFATTANLQCATAIGAYAQVQANDSIVLGSVDRTTKVGIGITVPSNMLSVSPLKTQVGTVTRTNSSTTLAGTGTTFQTNGVTSGDIIVFADGTTNTVASVGSETSLTMTGVYLGATDATPVRYRIHRPGFNVNTLGAVGIGTTNPVFSLDIQGDANITGVYRINGAQLSSSALSNDANLAKLNVNQTFTGNNTFSGTVITSSTVTNNGAVTNNSTTALNGNTTLTGTFTQTPTTDSATAFRIQNSTATSTLFNADTINSTITLRATNDVRTLTAWYTADFSSGWDWSSGDGFTAAGSSVISGAGAMVPYPWITDTAHPVTIGNSYQVTYTISGASCSGGNSIAFAIGGAATGYSIPCNGTYTFTKVATSATGLIIQVAAGTVATISNVQVKTLSGSGSPVLAILNSNGTANLEIRTTGGGSAANTYIGVGSGQFTSTGVQNTAVGYGTLQANTTGSYNAALGYNALNLNQTGSFNTAVGYQTLSSNVGGTNNTALGYRSLAVNTTGGYSVAVGTNSLQQNSTGGYNVAIGYNTLSSNTTGAHSVAIGSYSLQQNSTGGYNVAVGQGTLQQNTTGTYGTALGYSALYNNTTGTENTAVGHNALYAANTGINNTAVGSYSLQANTTGSYNSAFGYSALQADNTGSYNAAFGYYSLYASTGVNNAALGTYSLYNTTSGGYNTAQGYGALGRNTTGSYNTGLGYLAGEQDSGTLFKTTATLQRATAIGAYAQVQANDSIVLGSVDNTTKVGIGITVPSNMLSVSPLKTQLGKVTRTNSSTTLTGDATGGQDWVTANVTSGDIIIFADGTTNTVASVTDSTHLVMSSSYTGTTDASPVAYRIHRPGFNVTTNGQVAIGKTTAAYALDIQGDANLSGVYRVNGTSGVSTTCSGGQFLQNQTVVGGIVTGGTCAAAGAAGSYVSLQAGTPGTPDVGNINISGAGIFGSSVKAVTINATSDYQLNGVQITSAVLSNDSNLAKLDGTGPQTFTGNNKFTGTFTQHNATNSTAAFKIQDSAGATLLNADTSNGTITVSSTAANRVFIPMLAVGPFTTGWTATGWDIATDPDQADHNTANTNVLTNTSTTISAGETYEVKYWAQDNNGTGRMIIAMGGVTMYDTNTSPYSLYGWKTDYVTAVNTNKLTFTPTSDWVGFVTQVSIRRISGVNNPALVIKNSTGAGIIDIRANNDAGSMYIGLNSGKDVTDGTNSTAVGANTLQHNISGGDNVAFGSNALAAARLAEHSVAVGSGALSTTTDSYSNTAIGYNTMQGSYGGYNVAVGAEALTSNTSGTSNVAVGWQALLQNSSGFGNVAVGESALRSNTYAASNVAVGRSSLQSTTTGSFNTATGENAGMSNATGSYNLSLGYNAGSSEDSYNVTGPSFSTPDNLQNATAIGAFAQVQSSDSIVLGSVNRGTKVGIGITIPSNLLSVSPLRTQVGNVTRTNSSTTLTGDGADGQNWLTSGVTAGDIIIFADGTTTTVVSVTDATHLVMAAAFTGTTDAWSVAYRIHRPGVNVTANGQLAIGKTTASYALDVQGTVGVTGNFVQQTTTNSTTALQVQNSSATSIFTVDTVNGIVRMGDATNNVTFDLDGTASSFTLNGNARRKRMLVYTAEYAGAVLSPSGANNQGTMTSGLDAFPKSYYQWNTTQATAQSYDVVLRVALPSDFAAWDPTGPSFSIDFNTADITNGTVQYQVISPSGVVEGGGWYLMSPPLANTWYTSLIANITGGGYTTPNTVMMVKVRMTATSAVPANGVRIGDIRLGYLSKW